MLFTNWDEFFEASEKLFNANPKNVCALLHLYYEAFLMPYG